MPRSRRRSTPRGRHSRGPRRRPQRVGRPGGRLRPRARPEPADRATRHCPAPMRARARLAARSRPRPRRPARAATTISGPTLAALLEAREEARAARDFAASDRLRDELATAAHRRGHARRPALASHGSQPSPTEAKRAEQPGRQRQVSGRPRRGTGRRRAGPGPGPRIAAQRRSARSDHPAAARADPGRPTAAARALGRPRPAPDGPGGRTARDRPPARRVPWRRPARDRRARPRSGRGSPADPGDRRRGAAARPMAARATDPGHPYDARPTPRPSRPPDQTPATRGRSRRATARTAGRTRPAPIGRAPLRPTDRAPRGRPVRGPGVRPPIVAACRPRGPSLPAPDVLGPDEELVAGRRPVEEAFAARRPAHRLLVVPQRRHALEQLVLHATRLRIPIVEVEGGSLPRWPASTATRAWRWWSTRAASPRSTRCWPRRRARRAAVRPRARLTRGSAERGHPPPQRGGGRRPRGRVPHATPGAPEPCRREGLGGRRRDLLLCPSTTCPGRWPTCTATACAWPAPKRMRR